MSNRAPPAGTGKNCRKALSYTNTPYAEMTQGVSFARGCDNVIPGSLFTVNYPFGNILSIDAPSLYGQLENPAGTGKNGEFQGSGQKIGTPGQFSFEKGGKIHYNKCV